MPTGKRSCGFMQHEKLDRPAHNVGEERCAKEPRQRAK
jgi:hypothetical protein